MHSETPLVDEGLPACVWLSPAVCPVLVNEVSILYEGLPTCLTHLRLLLIVRLLMLHAAPILSEGLATILTHVWLLPGVRP